MTQRWSRVHQPCTSAHILFERLKLKKVLPGVTPTNIIETAVLGDGVTSLTTSHNNQKATELLKIVVTALPIMKRESTS